jgi:hypothetical protein
LISFRHGVVDRVSSQEYSESRPTHPRHEWARDLIVDHVGRAGAIDQRLRTLPAWKQLTSSEVLDFVLNTPHAYPPLPGRIGGATRQFGELTMVVSMFKATAPREIRQMLPGGYMSQFFWLIGEFGIRLGESDVAHLLLCHDDANDAQSVHLSYLPAKTQDMGALLAVDLLSRKERREYLR